MSEQRKSDHIELAFKSSTSSPIHLKNSTYEPLLAPMPTKDISRLNFLGHEFGMPLWVSSMTGGTEKAKHINLNLAKACKEFELGMGLGSCRPLLNSSDRSVDFEMREIIGDRPLYSNFGIAQIEELFLENKLAKISEVNSSLQVNGTIIHINPLQEWAQPEGDRYRTSPIDLIKRFIDHSEQKIIIKEVGQGMGPKSLNALLSLPIDAIEFGAFGGTNFTVLEQARSEDEIYEFQKKLSYIGHTADEMVEFVNQIENPNNIEFIISGGIKDPVKASLLINELKYNSIAGMASSILKYAMGDYKDLAKYLENIKDGFDMMKAFVRGNV